MKKIIFLVAICIFYLFANGINAEQPDSKEKTSADVKIEYRFMSSLRQINTQLKLEHIAITSNYETLRIQAEKENLELSFRGYIPHDVSAKRIRMEEEIKTSQQRIKELKREKNQLELDMTKYYKGSVPFTLESKWLDEELDHLNTVTGYYKIKSD